MLSTIECYVPERLVSEVLTILIKRFGVVLSVVNCHAICCHALNGTAHRRYTLEFCTTSFSVFPFSKKKGFSYYIYSAYKKRKVVFFSQRGRELVTL